LFYCFVLDHCIPTIRRNSWLVGSWRAYLWNASWTGKPCY